MPIPNRPNENCLKGLACPNPLCRSVGPFRIQAEACFTFTDDGTSEFTDVDFTDYSFMSCVKCDREGIVGHFHVLTPMPDVSVIVVADDGAVTLRGWQPDASDVPPLIRVEDISRILSGVAVEVPGDQLPGLPPDYVAFTRRPDPDINIQVLRPLNNRINHEFGGVLRDPVLLVRRSLLHLP